MTVPYKFARILLFVALCMASPAWGDVEDLDQISAQLLEARIQYWLDRGRPDRVERVLEQLGRVHPEHPTLFEVHATLAIQQRNLHSAQLWYSQLQATHPDHIATQRIRELIDLPESQQQRVAEAQILALGGRYEEAVDRWRAAFPEPPVSLDLRLQYWEAHARLGDSDAMAMLRELQAEHPSSQQIQLTILRVQAYRAEVEEQARHRAAELAAEEEERQRELRAAEAARRAEEAALAAREAEAERQARASEVERQGAQDSPAAEEVAVPPVNPWAVAEAAATLQAQGDAQGADRVFLELLLTQPSDDAWFAYALHLERTNRHGQARAAMLNVPAEQRGSGMIALIERLNERDRLLALQTEQQTEAALPARERTRDHAVLYLGFDYAEKSGTPGITELTAQTIMLDLRVPFASRDGFWFVRIDPTWLDAGAADLDNPFWRNRFGTGLLCEEDCPTGVQETARDQGVALGVGAEFDDWYFDIGRSPVGFNRSTWIGGIGHTRRVGEFGVRLNAERRILTSTMISFAGIDDPFSERRWGAVTRNGLHLSGSWDQGGRFGWWGSTGLEYYTGHEVESNSRWYAFTGGYMRAYDTEPLAVTLGINTLFWGFQEDLSQATYGQGNYYSPELYQSIGFPVTVFGRLNRFSYLVRGSVGFSDTRLHEQVFFPRHFDLQNQAVTIQPETGIDPIFAGGTGGGRSYSLTGVLEYKLTDNWYVGAQANLIRSDTFSPNQGLIYLRYHFGQPNTPVARPPDPPRRYVDR